MAGRAAGRVVASDHQIQLRRRQDAVLAVAQTGIHEDHMLRQRAKFEVRTHTKIARNQELRMMDKIQARHDETLQLRRERLAQLLSEEQEQYDEELDKLAETQEGRRDRIAQQAVDMRTEREHLRRQLADQQKQRAFRASCAPLREANSKAILLKVAADRAEQMKWEAAKKEQEKNETRVYDEMWEEDRQLKEQRAARDKQRMRDTNERHRKHLTLQADCNATAKAAKAQAILEEGQAMKQEFQRQLDEDAEAERRRRQKRLDFAAKNKEYNNELERIKDIERQHEMAEDKKFLSELVAKVKEDEERDRQQRRQMREDAVKNMRDVEQQMKRQAGAQSDLDRLWQEENDKEWNKREMKWRAEQQQRDDLLRDTYKGRAGQVQEVQNERKNNKQKFDDEKKRMVEDVERLQRLDREQAQARFNKAKENQKVVQMQINQKSGLKAAEKRDKELDFAGGQLAERAFQDRVKSELSIIDKTAPAQYSHLRVISSKPL